MFCSNSQSSMQYYMLACIRILSSSFWRTIISIDKNCNTSFTIISEYYSNWMLKIPQKFCSWNATIKQNDIYFYKKCHWMRVAYSWMHHKIFEVKLIRISSNNKMNFYFYLFTNSFLLICGCRNNVASLMISANFNKRSLKSQTNWTGCLVFNLLKFENAYSNCD